MQKLQTGTKEANKRIQDEITSVYEGREVVGKYKTLKYSNVRTLPVNHTYKRLSKLIDSGGTLSQKYLADVAVIDNKSKKVISKERKVSLGTVPVYTRKGGFLIQGNTYNLPHQIRLKSGAYTQNKANGDVETMMNAENGRGMKIVSPTGKNDVNVILGGKQFNAVDIATILGASEKESKGILGDQLFNHLSSKSNVRATSLKLANTLGLIGKDVTPPQSEVEKHIQEYFSQTKLDPSVTKHTLGTPLNTVNKKTILLGIARNVAVKKGAEEDDKENLMFKKIMTPQKLLAEGVNTELKKSEMKMKGALNNPFKVQVFDALKEPTLEKAAKGFMTTAAISRMPEEYNPLQTTQGNMEITPVGEGGISSSEMITPSVRSLHSSQLGFIDPIKSPEGANTGITLSLTHGAHIDKFGNPALMVRDVKTGKETVKTVGDLWDKKIAFPDDHKGSVGIRHKNDIQVGRLKSADYQLIHAEDMYGPAMNSLGMISSNDPTRSLMASKHVLQALPLAKRDVNPVRLQGKNGNMSAELAKHHLVTADTSGTVTKVDEKNGLIHYTDSAGTKQTQDYAKDKLRLNTKTYIDHYPIVKAGDKIKKGQALVDSNFTKDGELALGKNLRAAWMMFPGTRNDAFIVSEDAAKKMTSLHGVRFKTDASTGTEYSKQKFASLFPEIAKKIDMSKYDAHGIMNEGEAASKDEPITLGFRKMDPSEVRFENDKVKKLLYGGYAPEMSKWKTQETGVIRTREKRGNNYHITATYKSPLKKGDKVAGRSGNKGIISGVLPMHEMPTDETGKPLDIVFGGAGVTSRQNPAQISEAALTEVAHKTGKKYSLPHYTNDDLSEFAQQEADKNGVQLYHKVYDPVRKKHLKDKVFVAHYNTLKLFKQGEGTYSAIGHGPVDGMKQPKKGGKISASSISNMEINALLAHNARDFLREVGSVKSQENKDWFNAFEAGHIPPPPEPKSAREKFHGLLGQMNIKVHADGNHLHTIPMTDKDVTRVSIGRVSQPYGMKRNTMEPVNKGFYDTRIFGGHGSQYGHIDLKQKVINPFYKKTVASLLGKTEAELDKDIHHEGISGVYHKIGKLNTTERLAELRSEVKHTSDVGKADRAIKAIKAIKKLDSLKQSPSETMFISKIPVLPTSMRPPTKLPNGSLVEHDVNEHYANIIHSVNTLEEAKKAKAPAQIVNGLHKELQEHIGAMYGTNLSPNKKSQKKELKSVMDIVAGENPKTSFWHQRILKNKVFGSGRAVIAPHTKNMGIDQIELPNNVAWSMYEPHVVRKMSQMGIPVNESKKMIENRNESATRVLDSAMREIPVVINRAPSLHKHNMTGHYASRTSGNVMHIPAVIEDGQNADYDGDQLGIHVPFGHKAIQDVKTKIMASKQLMNSAKKNNLMMGIDLDPFIGFYDTTRKKNGNRKS